jgi:release factor glutamine methyltransferase
MHTIDTWLQESIPKLTSAGNESSRLDCLLLLEHAVNTPREWILAHGDMSVEPFIDSLDAMLKKRMHNIPIAYITHKKEFFNRTFYITSDVLVPRPESEEIITQLLDNTDSRGENEIILDIGTGSGILAITAKLELPGATVIATDLSEKALRVAKENAEALGAQIQLHTADLLDIPPAIHPTIILANLPYVPDGLITSHEIKEEPAVALFSGRDGLEHYKLFWEQLINFTHKPRYIIIESLPSQHKSLIKYAALSGYTLHRSKDLIQTFRYQ